MTLTPDQTREAVRLVTLLRRHTGDMMALQNRLLQIGGWTPQLKKVVGAQTYVRGAQTAYRMDALEITVQEVME